MTRAIFIVPLQYGEPQFPGVSYIFGDKPDVPIPGYGYTVGCQTPAKTDPQFVSVWLNTSQANVDILKAQSNCLYMVGMNDDGQWVPSSITPQERSGIVQKVRDIGYTGSKFGQAIALIQASQNSSQVATAVLTKLFMMTEQQIAGTFGAQTPKAEKEQEPVIVKATKIASEEAPRLGKCGHCGAIVYDVGTCPHCGAPIPAALSKPKRRSRAQKEPVVVTAEIASTIDSEPAGAETGGDSGVSIASVPSDSTAKPVAGRIRKPRRLPAEH